MALSGGGGCVRHRHSIMTMMMTTNDEDDSLGCYLPGKVICLPDPKIQEYWVLPGKPIFTFFLPGKNQKVRSF